MTQELETVKHIFILNRGLSFQYCHAAMSHIPVGCGSYFSHTSSSLDKAHCLSSCPWFGDTIVINRSRLQVFSLTSGLTYEILPQPGICESNENLALDE